MVKKAASEAAASETSRRPNFSPGRPRPAGDRSFPMRYVEALRDAKTKVADFFNIPQVKVTIG
jgi:hypothetical protein